MINVIAIGVHSAFAVGGYEEMISTKQARELIFKIAHEPEFKDASEKVITAEIDKLSQPFYTPKWQSNFLIEFDMRCWRRCETCLKRNRFKIGRYRWRLYFTPP